MPISPQLALQVFAPAVGAGIQAARAAFESLGQFELSGDAPTTANLEHAELRAVEIGEIESRIQAHLDKLGIASNEPFTLEVDGNGATGLTIAHQERDALLASIQSDELLTEGLRQLAGRNSPFQSRYTFHWPPSQSWQPSQS